MKWENYSAYKSFGHYGLREIPQHWDIYPLRKILKVTTERNRPDLPLLSVYRDYGVILRESRDDNYNRPGQDLNAYKVVRPGNLVINKMKAWQGSLGISEFEGIVSPAYIVCEVSGDVDHKFLHHVLRSEQYVQEYDRLSYGVRPSQWDMHFEDFQAIHFICPPFSEQRAIADFLNKATGLIDRLIAKKERQIELLQEKRDALISHAVTKGLNHKAPMKDSGIEFLGKIPQHWRLMRIAAISDKITNGYVGPTRGIFVDSGIPYLQSLHIKSNRIAFDQRYYVTESWSKKHEKSILREGDVLVVQTGDIGQVAAVPKQFEGANCHALIIISCKDVIKGKFLSLLLNSSYGYHSLKRIQTGALHPHLNCSNVRDIVVPVPGIEEQQQIILIIHQKIKRLENLIREVQKSTALLREYLNALVSAAVTGKIDVRKEVF